tara:strand:- start:4006 stop:4305 length:300 start_codon:yes stop_codon:yes gene_type:complete
MDIPNDDNRLKYEQTPIERVKELENKLIISETTVSRLEHELTKSIDEKIDAQEKLERHHKSEANGGYKEQYLQLKGKIKGLIYDIYIEDDRRDTDTNKS